MRKLKEGILMGSESDLAKMQKVADVFKEMNVAYEMQILSAHRLPDMTADYARSAKERGLEVVTYGAGMAAHLAGAVAALGFWGAIRSRRPLCNGSDAVRHSCGQRRH